MPTSRSVASWNQPCCEYDWEKRHPNRQPVRVTDSKVEKCAWCGRKTVSGIYVREDPHNVKFPAMTLVLDTPTDIA